MAASALRRVLVPALLAVLAMVSLPGSAWGQSVPPPTPVPPAGSPSPFPSTLDTPDPSRRPPEVSAVSSILVELSSGEVLFEDHAGQRRPIASLTKIMTALLVLENTAPRDVVTTSAAAAAQTGAELGLAAGEQIAVRELLFALLLQSANDAAVALAEHVAGGVDAFVDMMNRRSRELGLTDTRFASPNGLDDTGYSTAADLAVVTAEAYDQPGFGKIAATRYREIPAPTGAPRRIQNRNALLWLYPGAIGVKTGYTSAAGFCLAAAADRDRLALAAIVLGAPTEAFSDAAALLNFGFAGYERRVVVEERQSFDPLLVEGRPVPVGADAELTVLIRRNQDVTMTVRPAPGLSLPVAAGDVVGSVEVTVGSRPVGEVDLLALEAVTAVAADVADPWWSRLWDGLMDWIDRAWRTAVT
jgi:serine-type D-Ala-D-Ala carboxypeptidase (penicillin-binding protein 5/6)